MTPYAEYLTGILPQIKIIINKYFTPEGEKIVKSVVKDYDSGRIEMREAIG